MGWVQPKRSAALAGRYLAFIAHAFNEDAGRFRNLLSFDRRWLEDVGSEDSHGRTLWALGMVIGRSTNEGHVGLASLLFNRALPRRHRSLPLRVPGHSHCSASTNTSNASRSDRSVQRVRDDLADQLMQAFSVSSAQDWPWFEDILTYDNATLPRALLLAGVDMNNAAYTEAAVTALTWLVDLQFGEDGHFIPIGCHGFYRRGEERARFDQQPIEAYATIAACLAAFRVTADTHWHVQAQAVFDWFLGRNDLGVPLIDPATGACYDGLQPDWVNQNQGAESTLAFLLSLLELRATEAEPLAEEAAAKPSDSCRRREWPHMCDYTSPVVGVSTVSWDLQCGWSTSMPFENELHEVLFHRHPSNPILRPSDWPYPINTAFNPGVTRLSDGSTLLLCRVEDRRGFSHFCAARSRNGIDGWQIDPAPTLQPDPSGHPEELWGIEDAAHYLRARTQRVLHRLYLLFARRSGRLVGQDH